MSAHEIRIAIAVSKPNAWSETFIAAHLERLKEVCAVLSDGHPPRKVDGVSLLLPTTLEQRLRSRWELKVQKIDEATRRRRRTVELLHARGIQVVLAEYGNMGHMLVDTCREAGVPLVTHFHGFDAHVHRLAEEYHGYKALFAQAAALVVVSRSMEQRLLALGAPREKVHYNCYGIDVERFHPANAAQAPPQFLAVGRFVDKKAPQLTLLAFQKVAQRHPDARLVMVGGGPLWEACRQMVEALGLQERVELCGVQPPERIAALLRASRAFVQHSVVTAEGDSEGTPLAVLEAMASGLPVVATRHAGIADVVAHEERGLLCAERDVEAMAAHMLHLAEDPSLAGAMGARGRAYVEAHHRVEDRIAALQAILDGVAKR